MLSICIITKNEEERLEICLKQIKKIAPKYVEIVVVDTGSTDKTKEIAKKYTDSVYDFKWINDFSAARNFAADKAKNEYILAIDSDEYLVKFEKEIVEKFIIDRSEFLGFIKNNNVDEETFDKKTEDADFKSTFWSTRVYSRKYWRFERKVHEQLRRKDKLFQLEGFYLPITVNHVGYMGDEDYKLKKFERNHELLMEELEVEGENPYTLFQIGQNYHFIGNLKKSKYYLKKCFKYDLDPNAQFSPMAICLYSDILLKERNFKTALRLEKHYKKFKKSTDFVFYLGLIYMKNGLLDQAIEKFKESLTLKNGFVDGRNSYLSNANIGLCYEEKGEYEKALSFYEKAKNLESTKKRIEYVESMLKK